MWYNKTFNGGRGSTCKYTSLTTALDIASVVMKSVKEGLLEDGEGRGESEGSSVHWLEEINSDIVCLSGESEQQYQMG